MRTAKLSIRFLMAAARGLYFLGTVFVVVALVLSTGIVPASASPERANSQQERIFCNFDAYPEGEVIKVEDQQSPWTFTLSGPGYISVVGIKAATECAQIFTSDGSSECYRVSGIGTNSITVWDLEDAPASCREISHLELLIVDPVPTETPETTNTPTETLEVTSTPTNTPDPTNTPTNTPEPTETPTSTPDPTNTPENSTATPPGPTSTPENPTETPQDPTSTPQPSFTPTTILTSTPVPTVDQPEGSGSELLIPVTGVEMPLSGADGRTRQTFWGRTSANTGMLFFGLGMIFHGAALWKKRKGQPRNEDQESGS